jgi:hypothetical protein
LGRNFRPKIFFVFFLWKMSGRFWYQAFIFEPYCFYSLDRRILTIKIFVKKSLRSKFPPLKNLSQLFIWEGIFDRIHSGNLFLPGHFPCTEMEG